MDIKKVNYSKVKEDNELDNEVCQINQDIATQHVLEKSVTLFSGVGLIVGNIIGSGIFITPSKVQIQSGSVGSAMLIWTISGIISTLGALCFAELGSAIPRSGGHYSYMFEVIGSFIAYLFLWTSVVILRPAAVTINAIAFAIYSINPFYKDCEPPVIVIKLIACFSIISLTLLNCLSVKWSIRANNILTWSKLVGISIIIVIGIIQAFKGGHKFLYNSFDGSSLDISKVSLAFYAGLWAYDGWDNLNFVTGEMKNPKKDLHRAILIAMLLVTISYVLINLSFVLALGSSGILHSHAVALTLSDRYMGKAFWIMPLMVALSVIGSMNSTLFTNARLVNEGAKNNHLPNFLATIQNYHRTPTTSLIFSSFLSVILLIPSSDILFFLIDLFNFASWFFYGICFFIVIYLRWKAPNLERPYKVFIGIPIFMLLVSLVLVVLPFKESLVQCVTGVAIISTGIPLYFIFVKFYNKLPRRFKIFVARLTHKACIIGNLGQYTADYDEEETQRLNLNSSTKKRSVSPALRDQ